MRNCTDIPILNSLLSFCLFVFLSGQLSEVIPCVPIGIGLPGQLKQLYTADSLCRSREVAVKCEYCTNSCFSFSQLIQTGKCCHILKLLTRLGTICHTLFPLGFSFLLVALPQSKARTVHTSLEVVLWRIEF